MWDQEPALADGDASGSAPPTDLGAGSGSLEDGSSKGGFLGLPQSLSWAVQLAPGWGKGRISRRQRKDL